MSHNKHKLVNSHPEKISSNGSFGAKALNPITNTYIGVTITMSTKMGPLVEVRWKERHRLFELFVRSDLATELDPPIGTSNYLVGAELEVVENNGEELKELVGSAVYENIKSMCLAYRMGLT